MRNTQESEIRQRMLTLCEGLGISPNKLSLEMGKSRDYIRSLSTSIGSDSLQYIYCNYPKVNVLWIITGEGDMWREREQPELNTLLDLYREERRLNQKLQQEKEELAQEIVKLKERITRLIYKEDDN